MVTREEKKPIQHRPRLSEIVQLCDSSLRFPADAIVAARDPAVRDEFENDPNSSWTKVAHATVNGLARVTHWRNWSSWCRRFNFDTFLVGTPHTQHAHVLQLSLPESALALLVTANRLGANPLPQPRAMTPKSLFGPAAATPHERFAAPNPAQRSLAFATAEDQAPKPQLALPISVVEDVMKHEGASSGPKDQAHLAVLAFFFLLRVGTRVTRTTQIRRKDLQFWRKRPDGIMDRISPMAARADLLAADSVTITLDNQKNGQRDAALHHDALPNNPICPCKAAAQRFVQMRLCDHNNANAILSLCAPHKCVSAHNTAGGVVVAALRSVIWLQGCDLPRIGPHSLRASGETQLKLNGVSDHMIQQMGRWSSMTWLQCMRGNISCQNTDPSARMATPMLCFNVGTRAEN
jgi:integrase